MKTLLSLMICLGLMTSGLASAAEIKVGGGAAPMENIFKKIKTQFETASGVKLTLSTNGPEDAFKDLEAGKIHVAAGGVSINDWYDMMEKAKHPIADKAAYKSRVIGKDLIQVITHPAAKVSELTKDQMKNLFTGKLKNWKEVGGPDLPVVVVVGTKIPGTNKVFQKQILDGEDFVKAGAKEATDAPAVKQLVSQTAGAIGIGPMSGGKDGVNTPKIPEIGRPITAITKGAPSAEIQKLFDFIQGEGASLIAK